MGCFAAGERSVKLSDVDRVLHFREPGTVSGYDLLLIDGVVSYHNDESTVNILKYQATKQYLDQLKKFALHTSTYQKQC